MRLVHIQGTAPSRSQLSGSTWTRKNGRKQTNRSRRSRRLSKVYPQVSKKLLRILKAFCRKRPEEGEELSICKWTQYFGTCVFMIGSSGLPWLSVGLKRLVGVGEVKISTFVVLTLLLCGCGNVTKREIARDNIVRKTQELFDAVAPGNKQPWEKYIADDALYLDERGHNMDKKALVASIEPLPTGLSGTIKVVNSKVNIQGNTLIHSYDTDETENYHGQARHERDAATTKMLSGKRSSRLRSELTNSCESSTIFSRPSACNLDHAMLCQAFHQ